MRVTELSARDGRRGEHRRVWCNWTVKRRFIDFALLAICGLLLTRSANAQDAPSNTGSNRPRAIFTPVKPVTSKAPAGTSAPAANLQIGSGRFFSYAMPQGWRVGEDGQFALTLVAADNKALTVMVGNAGLPPNYQPGRFVYEKLMAMRPQNLQLGQARQARPVAGFTQAVAFDVSYSIRGVAYRGSAKCNIQTAYDTAVMAMTAAIAESSQWQGYSSWLPQVADQISATNGAAFGVRGIMAQNLRNSTAYAEAARNYREWSQRNWQQVTDERNASVDRRNAGVREILGGTQPYSSPFGDNRNVELPATYHHYWMDRQGKIVGTDDPSANPNQGSTSEWRPMKRTK